MRGLTILIIVILVLPSPVSTATIYLHNRYILNCSKRRSATPIFANQNHLAFVSNPITPTIHKSISQARNKIKLTSQQIIDSYQNTFTTPKLTPQQEADLTAHFSTLRSLGIDYGLSRTGLAVTTGGYRPKPLAILSGQTQQYTLRNTTKIKEITGNENDTVVQYDNTKLCQTIVSYAISERVDNLVLGLPLHKNGSISEQSILTRQFGMELLQSIRKECGRDMNVTLWDERYTSKEAASRIVGEAMARNADLAGLELSGCLDDEAACIILEHYYQVLGKDAEVLVLDEEVEEECARVYEAKLMREEERRLKVLEERERMWNARREMIERDRILGGDGAGVGSSKKKKKRKKKK